MKVKGTTRYSRVHFQISLCYFSFYIQKSHVKISFILSTELSIASLTESPASIIASDTEGLSTLNKSVYYKTKY